MSPVQVRVNQVRLAAVILAAGKGTRLKTDWPKVLHGVMGRPMLTYVIAAARRAGIGTCIPVVGYEKDKVINAFEGDENLVWVEQAEQKGTGHAVMVCRDALIDQFDHVMVMNGDAPLVRDETVRRVVERHLQNGNAATLATAEIDDPTGYGRVVRDVEGKLTGIVEHGDCAPEQRRIREINPGYYCFRVPDLLDTLEKIKPNNVKGEYYITDCISLLIESGKPVEAVTAMPAEDVLGINSRQDLALVNRVMRERILDSFMDRGVTIVDPATTWIDADVVIGKDTVVHPFAVIRGPAQIGANSTVGPFVHLLPGTTVGENVHITAANGGEG